MGAPNTLTHRAQHHLGQGVDDPVLDVSVAMSGAECLISSALVWTANGKTRREVFRRDPPESFGIPTDGAVPRRLTLPADYGRTLDERLRDFPNAEFAWLRLRQPAGYLSAVPWESIFLDVQTLMRLPEPMALPYNVSHYRRLAVVASSGGDYSGQTFEDLMMFLQELQRLMPELEVELFADESLHKTFDNSLTVHPGITLHPPDDSDRNNTSAFPVSRITKGLDGRSIQALHLQMPGAFDLFDPVLVAQNLTAKDSVRLASIQDVKNLADAVGAPLVSMSSANSGGEIPLRMIADDVGRTRPGPTIFASPLGSRFALPRAHYLIGSKRAALPQNLTRNPEIFCYVQPEALTTTPDFILGRGPHDVEANVETYPSELIGHMGCRALHPDGSPQTAQVPLWVAASSRFIESESVNIARLTPDVDQTGDSNNAYLAGAYSALADVAQIVWPHAQEPQ